MVTFSAVSGNYANKSSNQNNWVRVQTILSQGRVESQDSTLKILLSLQVGQAAVCLLIPGKDTKLFLRVEVENATEVNRLKQNP